jgi:DNA-binding transcriptional ArsR family regulator
MQMSKVSELFEKISHPTRVKILKLLEASPQNFSQLKNKLEIESSGNLDHHLKKLGDLILLDSGLYKVSDAGKEAIGAIRSIESSFAVKETYPLAQSRRIFGVLLTLLAIFIFVVTIMAVGMIPASMTSQQLIGLLGGLIGSIVGMLGAAFGLKGAIMADGRSSRRVTYFPSKKDPWMVGDWIIHFVLFGSYLTLMFSLIYVQMFSMNFPYKPLWFTTSVFALSTLFLTSVLISYRIIEKANKKIERLAQL